MQYVTRRWRGLALVIFNIAICVAAIQRAAVVEAATLSRTPSGVSPAAVSSSEAFFWIALSFMAAAQGILVLACVKFYRQHKHVVAEFNTKIPLEILWSALPAVFTVALASLSFQHLREASTSLAEMVLLLAGLALLGASTAILVYTLLVGQHKTGETVKTSRYADSLEGVAPVNHQIPDLENAAYSASITAILREPEPLSGGKR